MSQTRSALLDWIVSPTPLTLNKPTKAAGNGVCVINALSHTPTNTAEVSSVLTLLIRAHRISLVICIRRSNLAVISLAQTTWDNIFLRPQGHLWDMGGFV